MRKELTTPKAILIGISLIAVAIASIPYSKSIVGDAHSDSKRFASIDENYSIYRLCISILTQQYFLRW